MYAIILARFSRETVEKGAVRVAGAFGTQQSRNAQEILGEHGGTDEQFETLSAY